MTWAYVIYGLMGMLFGLLIAVVFMMAWFYSRMKEVHRDVIDTYNLVAQTYEGIRALSRDTGEIKTWYHQEALSYHRETSPINQRH